MITLNEGNTHRSIQSSMHIFPCRRLASSPPEDWISFIKRAEKYFNMKEEEVDIFVDLVSSWGDILRIRLKDPKVSKRVLPGSFPSSSSSLLQRD